MLYFSGYSCSRMIQLGTQWYTMRYRIGSPHNQRGYVYFVWANEGRGGQNSLYLQQFSLLPPRQRKSDLLKASGYKGRRKRAFGSNCSAAFFEAFRPPTPSRNFVSDLLKSINPLFVPPTTTFPLSPQASRYVFFTFSLLHTPPRLFYPIFLLSVES